MATFIPISDTSSQSRIYGPDLMPIPELGQRRQPENPVNIGQADLDALNVRDQQPSALKAFMDAQYGSVAAPAPKPFEVQQAEQEAIAKNEKMNLALAQLNSEKDNLTLQLQDVSARAAAVPSPRDQRRMRETLERFGTVGPRTRQEKEAYGALQEQLKVIDSLAPAESKLRRALALKDQEIQSTLAVPRIAPQGAGEYAQRQLDWQTSQRQAEIAGHEREKIRFDDYMRLLPEKEKARQIKDDIATSKAEASALQAEISADRQHLINMRANTEPWAPEPVIKSINKKTEDVARIKRSIAAKTALQKIDMNRIQEMADEQGKSPQAVLDEYLNDAAEEDEE